LAREVALGGSVARDRVDDPVYDLLHARLALRRPELAAEVLGCDDVRRGLRPELGDLDALLFEDVPALPGDDRIAELPLDLVVRVDAGAGEAALDSQTAPRSALDGLRRYVCDGHVRAPPRSERVRCVLAARVEEGEGPSRSCRARKRTT